MDLTVIVGGREYLRPRRISRRVLREIMATIAPRGIVPELAWTSNASDPYYDEWLYEDALDRDHRVSLLLDYLREAHSPRASLWLLLPFASATQPGVRDDRTEHFMAAANAWIGTGSLRTVRVSLSRAADDTLSALEDLAGGTTPRATHGEVESKAIYLDEMLSSRWDVLGELIANYNRALLSHAEARIASETVFGANFRADRIASSLERDGLYVRPDARPEDVVAQLSPGGELFALLARPSST